MKKIRHFDWLAPFYEKMIGEANAQVLLNFLDLQRGQLILEAGGGTGRVADKLSGDGRKVFIADLSFQMLRQAQQKNGLLCSTCDVEFLPFPDNSFDRIVIVDAFHHFTNQSAALREMWRVLRLGGILIIEEPDISYLSVKMIALLETILLMKSKFLKSDELRDLIAEHRPHKVFVYNQDYSYWITAVK